MTLYPKFSSDPDRGKLLPRLLFPLLVVFIALGSAACGEDGLSDGLGVDAGGNPFLIGGATQKGPFIIGSTVTISELGDTLDPSGDSFNTTTINNQGNFAITSELESEFVEIVTDGFYFDEVSNVLSSAPLTLRTISGFIEGAAINVNLLTQLARTRVKHLVLTGSTFADALVQVQGEVLAVFHITETGIADFDTLDLSAPGTGNAILLAVSAVLQQAAITKGGEGGAITAQLTALIAGIGADLEEDGTLDDEITKEDLRAAALKLDLPMVRQNLENRYSDLGETINAPLFEDFTDNDGDELVGQDEDNVPDAFSFVGPFTTDADPADATLHKSGSVTVAGVTGNVRVTLSNGTLIHNGVTLPVTTPADPAAGTPDITEAVVANNDNLEVALAASAEFDTTESAELAVGPTTAKFDVATFALSPFSIPTVGMESCDLTAAPPLDCGTARTFDVPVGSITRYLPVTLGVPSTEGRLTISPLASSKFYPVTADPKTGITETTVVAGDIIRVELLGSKIANDIASVVLTVGESSASFSVANFTPETISPPFDLGPAVPNAARGSVHTSDPIKVLDPAVSLFHPVTLDIGTLIIDGVAQNSNNALIDNANTVEVQLTASKKYSITTKATLTIGLTEDIFSVTTHAYPWNTTLLPSLGIARRYASGAALGGKIHVAGGSDKFGTERSALELSSPGGTWSTAASMPTARSGAVGAEANGLLYVIGGTQGKEPLPTVEFYNGSFWLTGAPTPTLRSDAAAAVVNNLIYVMGGSYGGKFLSTVEVYNGGKGGWGTGAPMPTPRFAAAAAVVNGLIYVIGGSDSNGILATVEVYNPLKGSWGKAAPMPTARRYATATAVNGKIYVMGGFNGKASLDTVEIYDPASKTPWRKGTPMPTARYGAVAVEVGGKIYVIGGSNVNVKGTILSTVEVYDPASDL